MLKIIALTRNDEPLDLSKTNIEEEVYFFFEDDGNSPTVSLNGNERWVWNFDEGVFTGSDQVVQEFIGFNESLPVVFFRPGTRTVSVEVSEFNGVSYDLKYSDTITFQVYKFPEEIIGADYVSPDADSTFRIDNSLTAESFTWFVNGQIQPTNTNSLQVNFTGLNRAVIQTRITNGRQQKTLDKNVIINQPNSVKGVVYESNVTPNLKFFNKEGDNLNFDYLEDENGDFYWDGEMIFHPNSSDTFKTIGLYILEKVDPIKFKSDDLIADKFQLFNERGIDFESGIEEIEIDDVQVVNNEAGYYSKWLIANNIQNRIPLGCEIILEDFNNVTIDNTIPENPIVTNVEEINDFNSFSSTAGGVKLYTVVGNRRDAIMVISSTENTNYSDSYNYGEFRLANNSITRIPKGKATCLNLIKVYDGDLLNSEWNEPTFKSQLYDRKKLTVVNSKNNDGVFTVNYPKDNESNFLQDKITKKNTINLSDLIVDTKYGFRLDVTVKTSKIFLSSSPVDFLPQSDNIVLNQKDILVWESFLDRDFTPPLLKSGSSFRFEQNQLTEPNLDNIFTVVSVGSASDILTPQTNDKDGYKLKFDNNDSLKSYSLNFKVGKTSVTIKESVDWSRKTTLQESLFEISTAINNKVTELDTIAVDDELWFWPSNNKEVTFSNVNDVYTYQSGVLNTNNPEYGVIAGKWVKLDSKDYDGYIHHRVDQGNYHVAYFEGSFPNITSSWYVLPISKKIVDVTRSGIPPLEYEQNIIADAYLEEDSISFIQEDDNSSDITTELIAEKFVENFSNQLRIYGLDVYLDMTTLVVERNYTLDSVDIEDDYVDLKFYKKDLNGDFIEVTSNIETSKVEMFNVLEDIVPEKNRLKGRYQSSNFSEIFERKIIIKDIDQTFGFLMTINGAEYPVTFDNISSSGFTDEEDEILDIQETLQDWGNQRFSSENDITPEDSSDVGRKYYDVLESLGVLVWLEKSEESYVAGNPQFDTLVIQSKYPNVTVTYNVNGTLNQHKILHSDIEIFEINNALTITVNNTRYVTSFNGNIHQTINDWIETYGETLFQDDIIVDSLGSSSTPNDSQILRFSTLEERTRLSYQIYVGRQPLPGLNLYSITDWRQGKSGIVISGNELRLLNSSSDFQTDGFGTGMLLNISNSKFPLNNQEYNTLFVDPNLIGLSYQGAFWNEDDNVGFYNVRSGFNWEDYDDTNGTSGSTYLVGGTAGAGALVLNTREFLRYPRERFDNAEPVQFRMSWDAETTDNSMFFYDFTGRQLTNNQSNVLNYTGVKPLIVDETVFLNREPNTDVEEVDNPRVQQTIFNDLIYDLNLIDSENDINPQPNPLETFIGYNNKDEGVNSRRLNIERLENIQLTIETKPEDDNNLDGDWLDVVKFDSKKQELMIENTDINFIELGFKIGQVIEIKGFDYINTEKQAIFKNTGLRAKITEVGVCKLKLDTLNKRVVEESSLTKIRNVLPPFRERYAAFKIDIEVLPKRIASINLRGQTEIEDVRYKVTLDNFGLNVKPKDTFIFKDYDIKENGVDWTFLNLKRKEMLLTYPEIYNYISSYRAIISSINYFGYNDLELNEYYLNVNPDSVNFNKLVKIEIPNIFNNLVEGYTENDFIKKNLPNQNFKKTKLFNLTYQISDFEGNNVLAFSLDEVITKLMGLKNWLKEDVIPVGNRIKDLTGVTQTLTTTNIQHNMKSNTKMSFRDEITPVDFEAEFYLQPVENSSKTYNGHIEFKTQDGEFDVDYIHVKIITYKSQNDMDSKLKPVQIINEYRTDLSSYNFALDVKVDPYVYIEVSCDNGYGASYLIKKSYILDFNKLNNVS